MFNLKMRFYLFTLVSRIVRTNYVPSTRFNTPTMTSSRSNVICKFQTNSCGLSSCSWLSMLLTRLWRVTCDVWLLAACTSSTIPSSGIRTAGTQGPEVEILRLPL